jgi:hypothetical protein
LAGLGAQNASANLTALPATTIFGQATTTLLSRSVHGGVPNGPSRNAAVSRDGRFARIIAFESDASDITSGDTNGMTDVFAVTRAEPYTDQGSPWQIGSTVLVSHGIGGQPANGRSYGPSVSGDSKHPAGCVAFVSDASNLVPGDTNGVADAFLWDARTGKISRVSVGSGGQQSNAPTYEVSVSGDCTRVAFTSAATNLAPRSTRKLAWKSATTPPPPPGHTQIYVRFLAGAGPDRPFRGLTMLASASNAGQPGNGDSSQPNLSTSGKTVVFTSASTNLDRGDSSPSPDVYARTLRRKFKRFRRGRAAQTILRGTRLVSATVSGAAGNGPSSHPAVSEDNRYVAYETQASDLIPNDSNGVSDVVRADLSASPPSQLAISKAGSTLGNGASTRASMSSVGHFVAFQSDASDLKMRPDLASDMNGVCDMMVGVVGLGAASVESLNALNRFVNSPSGAPSISARGNYVAFESADPLMDPSVQNPGVPSIYLRYLGPKDA